MSYEEIMKKITKGLTGEQKKDFKYLMDQLEVYKDHELSNEILRGIGRLIYDVAPEETRKELEQLLENDSLGMQTVLEEAEFQIHKKNFEKALDILEPAMKDIEDENGELSRFRDDSVSEYHHFQNQLEQILYNELMRPERKVRIMDGNIGHLYFLSGYLYFEMGRFEEAENALNKARKINPVSVTPIFESAEIDKKNKDWDSYLKATKLCLSLSYTAEDLARSYRNLGFYYIEQEKYDIAAAIYQVSVVYDPKAATMAQSQLFFIQQMTGNAPTPPKMEEIMKMFEENDIPMGANELVLNIAMTLANMAEKEKYYDMARYYYSIVYDLTSWEEINDHVK
jgi:tetratricopeptide (TPR) repeat protein